MIDDTTPGSAELAERPATAADAATIAAIHLETWRVAYAHVLGATALSRLPSSGERERAWREALAADAPGRWVTLAGRPGAEPVGFAAWSPSRDADADPDQTAELCALYVRPAAWGLGVGRLLLERGVARSRVGHFMGATLWVVEDNPRARRFYEAAGWWADGDRKVEEVLGRRVPEVRYRIDLRRPPAPEVSPPTPGPPRRSGSPPA